MEDVLGEGKDALIHPWRKPRYNHAIITVPQMTFCSFSGIQSKCNCIFVSYKSNEKLAHGGTIHKPTVRTVHAAVRKLGKESWKVGR
jgi:hypothetical protein